jgi:hypothetical protein
MEKRGSSLLLRWIVFALMVLCVVGYVWTMK